MLNTTQPHRVVRGHLFFALVLGSVGQVYSQCNSVIDLGPDTILCAGQNILLNVGPGFESYLWNNGSTAQFQSVSSGGTIICTVTDFSTSGELVVNGNFSAGAVGFSSDYILGTGGTYGLLSDAGTYGVDNNAQDLHTNFAPCSGYNGGGNLLVVNGAEVAGQNVWCQTVPVQANTNYAFSAWLASVVPSSPAQLQFTINGTAIGSGLNATAQNCNWVNFYEVWTSGSATSATICISNLNTSQSGNDFALDDISFAPFCTYSDTVLVTIQNDPEPDLGADLEACEGDAVLLDATLPGAVYSWQDGSTDPTFSPQVSGIYWVDASINGCSGRDSILVDLIASPMVDLGTDQQQCTGDVSVLDATNAGATYLWQNGSTTPTITVTGSGSYNVAVSAGVCTAFDTIVFTYHPYPVVDLGNDTTICADTVLLFNVERPGGTYLWNDGSTAPVQAAELADTYTVSVSENGCTSSSSMTLGIIELPVVDLGPDRIICTGFTEVLDVQGAGYNYTWSDGSQAGRFIANGSGEYGVEVYNVCGAVSDTIVLTADFCDCPVYIPNAYTPDEDGINDGFRPIFDCPTSAYVLRIFDRWGGLLWESDDPYLAWQAESNIPSGIYAWTLEIRPETLGSSGTRRSIGHVVLLR